MVFTERLKQMEQQYMFIKWIGGSEYGKLINVGVDYIEFDIIDVDTMEYQETLFLRHKLITEVLTGGSDISRIIAELSVQLSTNLDN